MIIYVGAKAQEKLLELAKRFQMQDVPYEAAYITLEDFLVKCGCYDEVKNPDYVEMEEPWNMNLPMEQVSDYISRYYEWMSSDKSQKTHKVFNREKVDRPLAEYFTESGVIYDGERVYLSEYHYNKHLNYVNSLKETTQMKK